ncbi:hypothetical protein OKA04_05690 [Luteolibacter flavescens]|uniref:Uncharacterized protein n=1 Tax=Luteolibacter flavescens TaxID=1859460 RepID=A0ABT3FKW0_9BACT|nr:hypothetical protein [Luteolibacter flavescens]MCW1884214.1 hypothetical protein [Luteolibacter flavescens]
MTTESPRSNRWSFLAFALLVLATLAVVVVSRNAPERTGASRDDATEFTDLRSEQDGGLSTKSSRRDRTTHQLTKTDHRLAVTDATVGFKVKSLAQLERLVALPGLTPQQQQELRDHFQRREDAVSRSLDEAMKRGLLDDAESGIRHADKLQEIVDHHYAKPRLDAVLQAMLTPEQLRDEGTARQDAAVKNAREQLALVVKHVDLDAAERDHVYEALCDRELAASADQIDLAALAAGPGGLQVHRVIDLLPAEKAERLRNALAEEEQRDEELLRDMFPGAGE